MAAETAANLFARLVRKGLLDGLDKKLFRSMPRPIQVKDVIELYGDSGSGKTQILLHLIANCILPKSWNGIELGGRDVGVIFVDTDFHFFILRLVEILKERIKSCISDRTLPMASVADMQALIESCLSRLIVAKCSSTEELLETVRNLEKILRERTDICVMMIDSISAFYWLDKSAGGHNYYDQEKHQRRLIGLLRRYVDNYFIVIIATVPTVYRKDLRFVQRMEDYIYMCRMWKSFVKIAYVVSRTTDKNSTFLLKQIRPWVGNATVNFVIDGSGVHC
ncbi:DNA repair protein XRCC2-like [Dendronephthya gigantea]|uniref:DNA repair protein XRCC2-like n=1 Tax=Dendronephthya gigantea TaxID=151771 RepID=UPI00106C5E91|nr:DNA repair protein XRCC2-like [Dendronephthya gigantea]